LKEPERDHFDAGYVTLFVFVKKASGSLFSTFCFKFPARLKHMMIYHLMIWVKTTENRAGNDKVNKRC